MAPSSEGDDGWEPCNTPEDPNPASSYQVTSAGLEVTKLLARLLRNRDPGMGHSRLEQRAKPTEGP